MVVKTEAGEQKIPIEDLYSVVIDNPQTVFTAPFITRLTQAGAHILLCDEKHLPASLILPHSLHYRPLSVIR